MPADKKSSLVQIAQDVLDTTFGAIKIVNADPSAGGATQVTAAAILVTVDAINAKTPAAPATAGNQTTTNTSLATIDGKTPALGQALAAASSPVVLTAAQITTLTPQTNALTDTQLRATAVPTQSGLGIPIHDALAYTSAATTDTYVYRTGGIAGSIVATVVMSYTDATKAVLTTVVRT